ncbi:hypothetical protein GCM10028792_28250 [Salinisphaera aquimarina]
MNDTNMRPERPIINVSGRQPRSQREQWIGGRRAAEPSDPGAGKMTQLIKNKVERRGANTGGIVSQGIRLRAITGPDESQGHVQTRQRHPATADTQCIGLRGDAPRNISRRPQREE